jgi:hypothetical protein
VISQADCDFAELSQLGFKIFYDFLGENVGIGEALGFFQAFVSEGENFRGWPCRG